VKLTKRHYLFPVFLWLYYRESQETRGEYLQASGFANPTEDSVEFPLERFPGWRYGTLRLDAKPPRLTLTRKDGCCIDHDFLKDASSTVEVTKSGCFVLHREACRPFTLCSAKGYQAVQFVVVWNQLPDEIRTRIRVPTVD